MNVLVDLRLSLPYVRDQGGRLTCLAFATSDAHSYSREDAVLLSADYLDSCARRRMVNSTRWEGLSLQSVSEALEFDGQPLEEDYPYTDPEVSGRTLPLSAPTFKQVVDVRPAHVTRVFELVESKRPAVVCIHICGAFYSPESGTNIIQRTTEPIIIPHAVLGVGIGECEGERFLLVRNSWGPKWGDTGHGWISMKYLNLRLAGLAAVGLTN